MRSTRSMDTSALSSLPSNTRRQLSSSSPAKPVLEDQADGEAFDRHLTSPCTTLEPYFRQNYKHRCVARQEVTGLRTNRSLYMIYRGKMNSSTMIGRDK